MTLKFISLLWILIVCTSASYNLNMHLTRSLGLSKTASFEMLHDCLKTPIAAKWIPIKHDIPIGQYFKFMDSIVFAYDSLVPYTLSIHLLVHAYPWRIVNLTNTDYYRRTLKRKKFLKTVSR